MKSAGGKSFEFVNHSFHYSIKFSRFSRPNQTEKNKDFLAYQKLVILYWCTGKNQVCYVKNVKITLFN